MQLGLHFSGISIIGKKRVLVLEKYHIYLSLKRISAGIQLGLFDEDGKLRKYQHYGIPPEHEVQFRSDGYPKNLHSWEYYGGTQNVTAVMHGMSCQAHPASSTSVSFSCTHGVHRIQ